MIEEVTEQREHRGKVATSVATQVDHQCLVLARLVHQIVYLVRLHLKRWHLPDQQVVSKIDEPIRVEFCVLLSFNLALVPIVATNVLHHLTLGDLRSDLKVSCPAVRRLDDNYHAGFGGECVIVVIHLPKRRALWYEPIDGEYLVAWLEPLDLGITARLDGLNVSRIPYHLHAPTILGFR